jgi:RNA polymerase sigma-70 factor (ECF subfamily)
MDTVVNISESTTGLSGETTGQPPQVDWESPEYAAIYKEHSQSIFYLALRMLGNPQTAEDATHDVFVKAFKKLHQFRGDSGIKTWLYRITINHCQNLMQTWHQRHIFTPGDDTLFERTPSSSDPLHVLEIKELGDRIQNTLQALPEEYRLLLLLVADEKLSYEEIAQLTDQTPDAVRGQLHRARKAFQIHFAKTA